VENGDDDGVENGDDDDAESDDDTSDGGDTESDGDDAKRDGDDAKRDGDTLSGPVSKKPRTSGRATLQETSMRLTAHSRVDDNTRMGREVDGNGTRSKVDIKTRMEGEFDGDEWQWQCCQQ